METTHKETRVLHRPQEVAEMLGISKATVYHLAASGQIPSVRVGKALRISREAIDRWIQDQERRTSAA